MRVRLVVAIAALTVSISSATSQSPVVLEATNTIHGVGNYTDKTLWVRLHDDGTIEWEENLDAVKRKKHISKISKSEVDSVKSRLESVDQKQLDKKMGPYAGYIDTSVELTIHLATSTGSSDFVLINPWGSKEKHWSRVIPMSQDVRAIVCEISRLRNRLSQQPIDPACEDSSK